MGEKEKASINEYGEISVSDFSVNRDIRPTELPFPTNSETERSRFSVATITLAVALITISSLVLMIVGFLVLIQGSPSSDDPILAGFSTLDTTTRTITTTLAASPTLPGIARPKLPSPSPSNVADLDRVLVPAGDFLRGSSREDIQKFVELLCPDYPDSWCREDAFEDELSRTEIREPDTDVYYISSRTGSVNSFYIDRHEVTNAEYVLCVESGVCAPPRRTGGNPRLQYYGDARYANYPVIYVSWSDAQTYCRWVEGRLPTGEEWEKAARGTDGRWWPWGNERPSTQVNFRRPGQEAANEEKDGTRLRGGDVMPVMTYAEDVSPYGVWDMAGNVMEWVATRYSSDRYEIRGGSWNTGSFTTRAASRVAASVESTFFDVGFRCVYDISP
jgi:formylglycine-generating enzyme required for sulfatase activity